MKSLEKLFFLCFLFEAGLCRDFSINLPERIEALSGLCVLIPCRFEIPEEYDQNLKGKPAGLWFKDGPDRKQRVFSSAETEGNKIQGKLTGDLLMKNCTTNFYTITERNSGRYYFRLKAQGPLRYTYVEPNVYLDVRDSPSSPSMTLYTEDQGKAEGQLEVVEGRSVSLICSAPAPCPSNPPTVTWNFLPDEKQNSSFTSSQLNFTASHLHHGLNVTCSATYQPENGTAKSAQSSVTLRVLYAPQIFSSSGCNITQDSIKCFCEVHGNPSPTLEWLQSGTTIPSSESVQSEIYMGSRSSISIPQTQRDSLPTLQCVATNQLGIATRCFSFMSDNHSSAAGSNLVSLLIGVSVGASAMLLLGFLYLCMRKEHQTPFQSGKEETAEQILSNRANFQEEEEESRYANKTDSSESLHYSTIEFQNGAGNEIKGCAVLTVEYNTVNFSSKNESQSEAAEVDESAGSGQAQPKRERRKEIQEFFKKGRNVQNHRTSPKYGATPDRLECFC